MSLAMSNFRLIYGSVCVAALLSVTGCGRTDSLIQFDTLADGAETWSYETTADTIADDTTDEVDVDDDSDTTDDWMTGEWGDDAIDTWGEDDAVDWGSETFDTFEETLDTFDTFEETLDTFDTFEETLDTFDTFEETLDTFDTFEETLDTFDTFEETLDTFDTFEDTLGTTDDDATTTGGPSCSDGAQCLIECGNFGGACVDACTEGMPDADADVLFDLQICAIQSCFFLGECALDDFNTPECVACRFGVNSDPAGFGCEDEGALCGI